MDYLVSGVSLAIVSFPDASSFEIVEAHLVFGSVKAVSLEARSAEDFLENAD